MRTTIIGPYPRVGSANGDALRKEMNNFYRGKGDKDAIERLKRDLTVEVVEEMTDAGITTPHYGMIDVHDELTWPLESFEGIEFSGMKKVFHTNTHYREPIVNYKVSRMRPILSNLHKTAMQLCPMKIEVPGPYTMAKHSVLGSDSPYKNKHELALDYADIYSEEFSKVDAPLIQFNEPSMIAFGRKHDDIETMHDIYRKMASFESPTSVCTYYGKYTPKIVNTLMNLPVDIVGIDIAWDPDVKDMLSKTHKGINIGLIDSGDRGFMRIENPDDIMKTLKELEKKVDLEHCYLSTNASLEHLPREYARKKVELIGEIGRRL